VEKLANVPQFLLHKAVGHIGLPKQTKLFALIKSLSMHVSEFACNV